MKRQKQLDNDPEAIQQIEFGRLLKNPDGENANSTQSMFVLIILEKIKERRQKFLQGCATVL